MPSNIDVVLADLKNYSVEKATADLIGAGVDEAFLVPMLEIFKNAIYNKTSESDLLDELSLFVNGADDRLGTLQRYIGQVVSDSVTQYTANYTQVITNDLELVFYKYAGNIQKDSRCFCKVRVNEYYHKKEIEAWGDGKVTAGGVASCGFPWAGMISGTNSSNIFTYRGGWQCEHYLIPVSITSVPRQVVIRNIENGNYFPSEKVKTFFGL